MLGNVNTHDSIHDNQHTYRGDLTAARCLCRVTDGVRVSMIIERSSFREGVHMNRIRPITAMVLICILLAACGGQKDNSESTWKGIQAGMDDLSAITERTEYEDIAVESEPIFQWDQEEGASVAKKTNSLIGMQFYQGEPVQLWRIEAIRGDAMVFDLCLYRQDGSREVLLQAIKPEPGHHGYLDQEGNLYLWYHSSINESPDGSVVSATTALKKYDSSMELLYEREMDYGHSIQELRQTADGRIYLYINGGEPEGQNSRQLAELDPATGNVTELAAVSLGREISQPHFGTWGERLVMYTQLINGSEIRAVDVKDGSESSILSFQGASYVTPKGFLMQDFRILEDCVEILWTGSHGSESICERLRMEKVEKIPVVLRGMNITGWIAARIDSFNRQNETYHVVVEDCGQGNDWEDLARLTSVEIASGKGPDIIECGLMKDYMAGMLEKGALEDLSPYMERSGIREEDYFPFTFGTWRQGDKIYGVSPESPGLTGFCMDSTVLEGTGEPDIDALVNALLAEDIWQGDDAFLKGYDSQKLLALLLKGKDTLWGMVDWEKGGCDFKGELFAKILDVAKRYGDNGDRGSGHYIAKRRSLYNVLEFDDRAERERDGKVVCGMLFDDGCQAAVLPYSVLAVNANASHKEGAWEFISFLLGDEAQLVKSAEDSVPVSRKAFDAWIKMQRERVADGKEVNKLLLDKAADGSMIIAGRVTYSEADITDEIVAEYKEILEDARPCPNRTVPILDIVSEEAADYFSGTKSAAEVGRVVTNRVQTYLDEGR